MVFKHEMICVYSCAKQDRSAFCSGSGALTSLAVLMQLVFQPCSSWFPAKNGIKCWWMLMNPVEHLVTEEPAWAGIAWNDRWQSTFQYSTCETAVSHLFYMAKMGSFCGVWHSLMSFLSRRRFRINITDINMDAHSYFWNHKSDKCDKIPQSLLLLFQLLCVDRCIAEGLHSLASLPPNWCSSEVHGPEKQTFVMFEMNIWCWCRWRGRWITKIRSGCSPLFWTRNKRRVLVHAPSDGPACRQCPDTNMCEKRGNGKVKRRKVMSPGHWFFPELRCQSGSSVHITDLSHLLTHHFPAGITFYLSLHHKKNPKRRSPLIYLPAFVLFLRPMCAAIGCGGGDGKHVMADQVTDDTVGLLWCPSGHVTWWRGCTSRPVLAETCLSCSLFCVYYSMFLSLDPSMRTWRHVEIHTTLPAHSKAFSLKLLTHPLYLLPSIFFFRSFFQA